MANSRQLFEDDEKLGKGYLPDDDALREVTGINPGQEEAYDREAGEGAAEDLAEREKKPADSPKSDKPDDKKAESADSLGVAEAAGGDVLGKGFNAAAGTTGGGKAAAYILRHRKKGAIGLGVTGGIVAALVIVFLAAIPLKIENMVQNLQHRFFATSENAVEKQTQSMLEQYIVNRVLPSYKKCGSTVSAACRVGKINGTNPVANLYDSWGNAKIETKLATKYGIEFKYNTKTKTWLLKAPGTAPDGDGIGPNGERLKTEFQRADRATMRAAVRDAMGNETQVKKLLYRYKVGRLLEQKYGVKRCIIFCGVKDALADNVDAQKRAAKLYLVQRVITPRNQSLGIVLQCLFDPNCVDGADDTSPSEGDGPPSTHGAPENPDTDRAVREGLTRLAAQFGVDNVDELMSLYGEISEDGFQKYLVTKGLTSVGINEAIAGTAADKIPIIGWINMGAEIVNTANGAGPAIKKLGYVTNAASAVSLYMMYRTYADEIHTGHVTAAEVGSLASSLGDGNSGEETDPEVGGTASAEGTPLYASLIAGTDGRGSSDYVCKDGKPVPQGKLVCDEEVLGQGNGVLNGVHDFLNLPFIGTLTVIAQIWKNTIGKAFSLADWALGWPISQATSSLDRACKLHLEPPPPLTGYCTAKTLASALAPKIIDTATNWLIPNPFSTNMSGGRTFDMMAAGADVAGNDTAHTTLGGQKLTDQQVADITNEQNQTAKDSFTRQPLFARMFSTDTPYSLVSRMAMAVPFNTRSAATQSIASLFSNPFGALSHSFMALLTGRSSAAGAAQPDPFGITQYGYPSGTIPDDPEAYWNDHCSDDGTHAYQKDNAWNEAAANGEPDPNTGLPVNTTANPCLLIKATVGAAGGLFNEDLLTPDDRGINSDSTDATDFPGSGSSAVTTNTSYVFKKVSQADVLAAMQRIKKFDAEGPAACGGNCSNLCDHMAGEAYGYDHSGYPTAYDHWQTMVSQGLAYPKSKNIPVGALLFWDTGYNSDGTKRAGHVVVYVGNGMVATTDRPQDGDYSVVPFDAITSWLGGAVYLGWTEPVFGS